MITDGHNPFTVMLFVGGVLIAFVLVATYTLAQNSLTVALLVGFVSGVFGADSIGVWLIKLGTLIRNRGT